MKIPKLLKKAAAFVMAAVTALSIMPATAFAAGDIGTISFSHTYDSNGNAMRYNSSANIGGYTAGGTGNYKYRMFVDGENAFCIQPGVPLKTGNTLKKASSDTWNALSANQKKAVGLALLYGYQGNRNNLSGSDDEKWLATQTLVWEFVTGCREATGSYNQTSTTVYSLHFGSNYANSGARAVYDQIVAMLREHNTIPSFMSGGKNDITKELAYKDGKYSITLTDSNGVLSDYSFSSSDSNVSVSKSGNKLTISSTVAISGSVRITAKRNNVPTVSSSAKLIAYGDPNLQDLVTGVENADTVSAYINIETPTGTIALKKTSEDGVVEGISFTIKGDNFNKTVKTGKDGSVSVEGLFPGTYTVTEQSIDRYEPQKTQTVTLIGGKTSTVTFSNTLKRGSLEIVKTSEDNLVEGMKFHLYGTSLSGLPVDEYAVTDKNGLAKFENVLISGDTPYVVEEVDTAVRYVVPASQTAAIEWNKVTKRSFDNVLKKFQVTVTKTDAETGSPQGDASLAGAVYGIYKGEELIDTYTTDENGQFTTKYYICDNDWTVREISPSEGYLLDTAIHKVGAEPELYTVELNSTANDVNEQVIKGNIALIKHIETGSDQILKLINKGFNADTAVKSGCMAKEADMILSEFILLGIGGKELSEENATRTAEALNVIRPDFIRVHATGIKPESKMGEFVREGSFTLQSEEEIMIEQKRFLQQLKEMDSYYVNEHIINLLLEVRGNLRTDKEKMLSDINRFLNLPANEKLLFVIGRRFNIFFMLDDLNNQELHKKAEGALQKILNKNPEVDFTVLCNYIRQSQI